MTTSDLVTQTLDVPGAQLYCERRGAGPVLAVIGSPMASGDFAGLAGALADRYTVVSYDPRGIGGSRREDTTADVTPQQQADDVHRLLSALGSEPAYVFGSSGGAVVGLALVTAHPGQVRTLVAHEPPVIGLMPDREQVRAQVSDIYDTYLADGPGKAMQKFMAVTGIAVTGVGGPSDSAPPQQMPAGQAARMRAGNEMFLAHLIRPTTSYQPDIEALRASPARIVVGVGAESKGQLANRAALALAGRLGVPAAEFPGDHVGFIGLPGEFGGVLHQVLTQTT